MTAGWGDDDVAEVRRLAADSRSGAEIAKAIAAARPGTTRNSIISLCHRLGIQLRSRVRGRRPGKKTAEERAAAAVARAAVRTTAALAPTTRGPGLVPAAPERPRPTRAAPAPRARVRGSGPRRGAEAGLPLLTGPVRELVEQLTADACRWPSGDITTGDLAFCGRPRWTTGPRGDAGLPYCEHHYSRAVSAEFKE